MKNKIYTTIIVFLLIIVSFSIILSSNVKGDVSYDKSYLVNSDFSNGLSNWTLYNNNFGLQNVENGYLFYKTYNTPSYSNQFNINYEFPKVNDIVDFNDNMTINGNNFISFSGNYIEKSDTIDWKMFNRINENNNGMQRIYYYTDKSSTISPVKTYYTNYSIPNYYHTSNDLVSITLHSSYSISVYEYYGRANINVYYYVYENGKYNQIYSYSTHPSNTIINKDVNVDITNNVSSQNTIKISVKYVISAYNNYNKYRYAVWIDLNSFEVKSVFSNPHYVISGKYYYNYTFIKREYLDRITFNINNGLSYYNSYYKIEVYYTNNNGVVVRKVINNVGYKTIYIHDIVRKNITFILIKKGSGINEPSIAKLNYISVYGNDVITFAYHTTLKQSFLLDDNSKNYILRLSFTPVSDMRNYYNVVSLYFNVLVDNKQLFTYSVRVSDMGSERNFTINIADIMHSLSEGYHTFVFNLYYNTIGNLVRSGYIKFYLNELQIYSVSNTIILPILQSHAFEFYQGQKGTINLYDYITKGTYDIKDVEVDSNYMIKKIDNYHFEFLYPYNFTNDFEAVKVDITDENGNIVSGYIYNIVHHVNQKPFMINSDRYGNVYLNNTIYEYRDNMVDLKPYIRDNDTSINGINVFSNSPYVKYITNEKIMDIYVDNTNYMSQISIPIIITDGDNYVQYILYFDVVKVNSPPKILRNSFSIMENKNTSFSESFFVYDVDSNPEIGFTSDSSELKVYNNYLYHVYSFYSNISGIYKVNYTIVDGMNVYYGSMYVDVDNVNDAPVIKNMPEFTIYEGQKNYIPLKLYVMDEETPFNKLFINITFDNRSASHITYYIDNDGLMWINYNNDNDSLLNKAYMTINVSDGQLYTKKTFTLKLVNENDKPYIVMNKTNYTMFADDNWSLKLNIYDNDSIVFYIYTNVSFIVANGKILHLLKFNNSIEPYVGKTIPVSVLISDRTNAIFWHFNLTILPTKFNYMRSIGGGIVSDKEFIPLNNGEYSVNYVAPVSFLGIKLVNEEYERQIVMNNELNSMALNSTNNTILHFYVFTNNYHHISSKPFSSEVLVFVITDKKIYVVYPDLNSHLNYTINKDYHSYYYKINIDTRYIDGNIKEIKVVENPRLNYKISAFIHTYF